MVSPFLRQLSSHRVHQRGHRRPVNEAAAAAANAAAAAANAAANAAGRVVVGVRRRLPEGQEVPVSAGPLDLSRRLVGRGRGLLPGLLDERAEDAGDVVGAGEGARGWFRLKKNACTFVGNRNV